MVVVGVPSGGAQSSLVEEEGLHAARLEFGQLVADDLRQHLGELHAQRLVDKRVEAEVEQPSDHLQHTAWERGERAIGQPGFACTRVTALRLQRGKTMNATRTKRLLARRASIHSATLQSVFFF